MKQHYFECVTYKSNEKLLQILNQAFLYLVCFYELKFPLGIVRCLASLKVLWLLSAHYLDYFSSSACTVSDLVF